MLSGLNNGTVNILNFHGATLQFEKSKNPKTTQKREDIELDNISLKYNWSGTMQGPRISYVTSYNKPPMPNNLRAKFQN